MSLESLVQSIQFFPFPKEDYEKREIQDDKSSFSFEPPPKRRISGPQCDIVIVT